MSKQITGISFQELLPSSIAGDPTIANAAKSLDAEIQAVNRGINSVLLYSRIDELPDDILNLLAWQLDVDFWSIDLPIENKRDHIRNAIAWHKKKGTKWAVTESLKRSGYYAEIITYHDALKAVEKAGGIKLNSSWSLNGSRKLIPFSKVSGAAWMESWAQFCVKLDILSSNRSSWEKEARQIVDAAKPVRSHPVWLYFLKLEASIDFETTSVGHVSKHSFARPLRCKTLINGSWKVGRDPELISVNGSWELDGSFSLGQILQPAMAQKKIVNCRLDSGGGCKSSSLVYAGFPAGKSDKPFFNLSTTPRKIDGMWALGAFRRIDGTWQLKRTEQLLVPVLGRYAKFKLKDKQLGYKKPESRSWPQISGGIYGNSNIN